eukprot:g64593.t1
MRNLKREDWRFQYRQSKVGLAENANAQGKVEASRATATLLDTSILPSLGGMNIKMTIGRLQPRESRGKPGEWPFREKNEMTTRCNTGMIGETNANRTCFREKKEMISRLQCRDSRGEPWKWYLRLTSLDLHVRFDMSGLTCLV